MPKEDVDFFSVSLLLGAIKSHLPFFKRIKHTSREVSKAILISDAEWIFNGEFEMADSYLM